MQNPHGHTILDETETAKITFVTEVRQHEYQMWNSYATSVPNELYIQILRKLSITHILWPN